ncbi:unnamed protein product [Calypogeia fissa]
MATAPSQYIAFNGPEGKLLQKVTFLNHPDACYKCKQFDHQVKDCSNAPHFPNYIDRSASSPPRAAVQDLPGATLDLDPTSVNAEADVPIGPSAHPITSTVPPLAHSPVPLFRPSSNLNLGGVSTPGGSPSTLPISTQIGTPLPPVGATLSVDPMLDTGIGNPVGPSDVLVAPLLGPLLVGDSGWYDNGFSSDDTSIRAKSHYSQASKTSKPESRRWRMYVSDFDRSMQFFSGMSLSSSWSLRRPGQHRFTNTLQYEQMLHSGQPLDPDLFKMAKSPSATPGDSALHEGSATASVLRSWAMYFKSGWLSSDAARERNADPKVAARKAFQKQQLEAAAPSSSTHTIINYLAHLYSPRE